MKALITRILGGALAGAFALAGATAALAQGAEPLKVRLDWTPWGVHAPFYLAQQKGWFSAAGLNVQIEDGNGSVTTVQIVGAGDQFDVGHASLATMAIARDKGLPVKAVALFARLSDIGLLVPQGSGIKGPKDLKGKKIAYTAGSLEAPFIDPFLAAGGLKKSDVELINVDAAGKAATYAAGRSDAAFSSIPYFLPVVSQTRPSDGIRFADYNLNMPSYGLFATDSKIASRREALTKFSSIVAAAWQYIYNGHEDEAVEAIVAQRPQAKLDKKALRGQIDTMRGFFELPLPAGRTLGAMVPADWSGAVKTMTEVGLLKNIKDGTEFYVSDMVRPFTPAGGASK